MKYVKRCLSAVLILSMAISMVSTLTLQQSKVHAAGKAEGSTDTNGLIGTEGLTDTDGLIRTAGLIPVQSPSGITYDARVSFEVLTAGMTADTDAGTRSAVVRFTLENPSEQPVSFRYTAVSGSADTSRHLTGTLSGTVALSKDVPTMDVTIGIAPFVDKPGKYGLPNDPDAFWTGKRVFYLFCDNVRNALFDGGRDSLTVPVPVESEFDYAAAYENASTTKLIDLDDLSGASSPGVYPIPDSDELKLAAEISGDVRKMLDAGVFTHIHLPEGYFQNDNGTEGSVTYRTTMSRMQDGSKPVEAFAKSINLAATGQTPFYNESFEADQPVEAVYLRPFLEANGIVRRLDFIFDYYGLTGPVDTCFMDADGQYVRRQVGFSDGAAPEVISIATGVPVSGTSVAQYGAQVPIVIGFSEPVCVDDITFKVGEKTLHPMEGVGTISEAVSFLYSIGDEALGASSVTVDVYDITGAIDLSGKAQESPGSDSDWVSLASFDPERTLAYCAEPSVTLLQGISPNAEATVSIPLKWSGELSNWLVHLSRLDEGNISTAVKARAITATGTLDIPLTVETNVISATGLTGTFTAPENTTGENEVYALEIYVDVVGDGSFSMVYGLATVYVVPPLIVVEDESDLTLDYTNWPPGNSVIADAGASLSLGYILNVAATWQGADYFTWSSNDEDIAAIDASGSISLTGALGTVSFTLTVKNPLSDDSITFESRTLTVLEADGAYLYVPNALKNQEILQGREAKISFSSNLSRRNGLYGGSGTETDYMFGLYAVEYEGDTLKKGGQLSVVTQSATEEIPVTSYTVPAELLTNATEKGRYGYILEISAQDMQSGQTYAAEAAIRVRVLPAKAVLTRPDSVFLTDSSNGFDFNFDIENKNAGTEYLLTVMKNSLADPVMTVSAPEHIGHLLTVELETVPDSRLLDVYTVSLKAKNGSDEAWSYDSYCVYVYNTRAMKLLLNGIQAPGSLTMEPEFDDGDILYGTHLLLKSRWSLGLSELVSIDGTTYPWSVIADRVTWRVEGDSVSLWYGSGGASRQIGGDYNPLLLPGTNLILQGDGGGNSVVIATHTLTGMSASMKVAVETLNDKLYLFRIYPQVPCEIVYTNGRGAEKTVSAPFGEVGVYEERGIAGDVVIHPTGGAETVYDFVVLSHGALMANQRSSGDFDLYPMNTVKLPRINYDVSLQLFDEKSGGPYTEDVVVRGGLYLNDVYQSSTTINGNMGNADQIVSPDSEGRYCLSFRPADFANKLCASDKLIYVIEVGFTDNSYLTKYVTVDNDAIQAGKASPLGVCVSAGIQALDVSAIQNSAVVLSETLVVDGEEKPMAEVLYLDEIPESVFLNMTLTIPGDSRLYYRLHLQNTAGTPSGSSNIANVVQSYPFSDEVTLGFSYDARSALWYAMMYGVEPGERIDFYPTVRSTDGSTEIRLSKPVKVLNLLGIPEMRSLRYGESDYNDIMRLITNMSFSSENLSFSDKDNAVKDALDFLEDYATYSANMGLEIQSTDDPLVYKGIIRFAAGSYSKDNPSGVFVGSGEKTSFKFMPGVSDVKAMAKGTFLQKAKEEMKGGGYKSYGGGAYLECEVYYSVEKHEWKIRLLKGDIYLGGGGGYRRNYNSWVGFVPVTTTFDASLTAELDLTILPSPTRDFVAYVPRLRPVFSIYGFGGVGRDYEIVALKAGVYGLAEHEQLYLWYRDSDGETADGQRLKISGEVGVEYKIRLLFVELHGKYALTEASKSWTYNDFNSIYNKIPSELRPGSLFSTDGSDNLYMLALVPIEESASFEDRSYLGAYDRHWGSKPSSSSGTELSALSSGEGLTDLWTNAYPYAAPSISDDGQLMAYLSDMGSKDVADTAACLAVRDGTGAFSEGSEIDESDYPDSNLSLSGTGDGASAVWIRSFTSISGEAGGEATAEDAVGALAASEIMAGIYKGKAFTVARLTDNSNPDLAPVTAVSGDRAIAAWRSVTLGTLDNPLDFTSDYILYSVYDGTNWSPARCLYDGSVDGVNTLNAAMLPDGNSAIVYQIAEAEGGDSEIICAVLNAAGEVVQTTRLTDNVTQDENPRIVAVEFPDGALRFVVGWNAESAGGESAVRLVAVNADGTVYPDFALELSDNYGARDYAGFRFTKGADKIEDLSVLWSESGDADGDGVYEDTVFGAKLLATPDGVFSLSGKAKLVAPDEGRKVDFMDARVDPEIGRVHHVILLSEQSGASTLATAVAEYHNSLTLKEPYFQYEDVIPELEMPVRFTLTNDGVESITDLTIVLGDQTYEYKDVAIVPGETKDFLVSYCVPEPVKDADYTVTARFGVIGETDTKSGSLKLARPDVGICQIDLTKETGRERGFTVLLQNSGFVDLKEGIHSIRLEVSDSANFDGELIYSRTLSDAFDLAALNDSLLPIDVTVTETDLQRFVDREGEIPLGGAWVFFRIVLAEGGRDIEDADVSNDTDYVRVQSLIEKNGAAVSLASLSQTADGKTEVRVEAANNSMKAIPNGKLIVTLMDENGNAIETKETYDPAKGGGLLSIAGEESLEASLQFSRVGYATNVAFATVSEESVLLSALNMTDVPLEFRPEIYDYSVQTYGLADTFLAAVPENPASHLSVTHNAVPVSASELIPLAYGTNVFVIKVTTGDTTVAYTVNLQNNRIDDEDEPIPDDDTRSDETPVGYMAKLTIGGASERHIDLGVRLSGGYAVASLGHIAQEIFSGEAEAALTVPAIPGAKDYVLELPADTIAGSYTGPTLTFATPWGSVRIPSGMLARTAGLEGKTAGIVISKGDKSVLSDDLRTVVGDRPLIGLSLTLDGRQTDWNNPEAPVAVSIPYEPTADELENPEGIIIWHIDGSGRAICVPSGRYSALDEYRDVSTGRNDASDGQYGAGGAVILTITHFSDFAVGYNNVSFGDVPEDSWYKKPVSFIAAREITNGTGDGKYSPEANLTRGQFIVLMMRAYEIMPDKNPRDNFVDAGDTYYTGYLATAKRLGISKGIGDNKYAPEAPITRQDMFVLLYNALETVGRLPDGDSPKTIDDFSDSDAVSAYAQEAMTYFVKVGVVSGDNNLLLPMATATRAEMAQVLYNLFSR